MNLIQSHGRVSNVALKPTVSFGGDAYADFVAQLNRQVKPASSSGKVALAIPPTAILKGATTVITLKPLVDFKGEQLVIADSGAALNGTAGQFVINSIKVGRDEQFVAAGSVPAQVFSQLVRRNIGLNMKTCPTSLSITISVTNLDATVGASHVFAGMLVGTCGGCNEGACGVASFGPGDAEFEPLVALAIPTTLVGKSATATISIPVEVAFTGQQLVVPTSWWDATGTVVGLEDVSANFTIDSIKVGRDEMMTSTDPLSANLFAITSQRDIGLSMKKCPTQLTINVTVTNLDPAATHEFTGAFYGFCGDSGNCNTGLCSDYDIGVAAPALPSSERINGQTLVSAAKRILAMAPNAPSPIY